MASSVLGLHHVTAIAGDPQQNIDFYTQVLGLRLVKATVDIHDPGAYHLFYGTGSGQPGTLLTFYCWPGAIQGRAGTGQVQSTGLGVPPRSLPYWRERLTSKNVTVDGPHRRGRLQRLSFLDCDGLMLELVADGAIAAGGISWRGPIPIDRAIRGLYGVTISADSGTEWERFLITVLGLETIAESGDFHSYAVPEGRFGARVDIRVTPDGARGLTTVGSVHHTAFRVPDHELEHWRSRVAQYTDTLDPIEEHVYYRAVRLEGPEGVRLELASDGPGLTADEAPMELGTHLVLPPWLEIQRSDLERRLPPLVLPDAMR